MCYFLETNSKQYNLVDKNVIEIGAGTGLVSIVASLLGEYIPLLLYFWKSILESKGSMLVLLKYSYLTFSKRKK